MPMPLDARHFSGDFLRQTRRPRGGAAVFAAPALVALAFLSGCVTDPGVRSNPQPAARPSNTTMTTLAEIARDFPPIADRGPWNAAGLEDPALRAIERKLSTCCDVNPTSLVLSKMGELTLVLTPPEDPGRDVALTKAFEYFKRSIDLKSKGSQDWIPGWLGMARVEIELASRALGTKENLERAESHLQSAVSAMKALNDFKSGPGAAPTDSLRPGVSPEEAYKLLVDGLAWSERLCFDWTAGSTLLQGYPDIGSVGAGAQPDEGIVRRRVGARVLLARIEYELAKRRFTEAARAPDDRLSRVAIDGLFFEASNLDVNFVELNMRWYRELSDASLVNGAIYGDEAQASKSRVREVWKAAYDLRAKRRREGPGGAHPQPGVALAREVLAASFVERLEFALDAREESQPLRWEKKYGANWKAGTDLVLEVVFDESPRTAEGVLRYPDDGTIHAWLAGLQAQDAIVDACRRELEKAQIELASAEGCLALAKGKQGAVEAMPKAVDLAEKMLKLARERVSSEVPK